MRGIIPDIQNEGNDLSTSLKITGTYDYYKKKSVFPQDNHVLTKKLYYGRETKKNGLQSRAGDGSPGGATFS